MADTATQNHTRVGQKPAPATAPLVAPPKLRRRPAVVAAAVIAICLGALLGAWTWATATDTQEVLAARSTIERGSVIGAEDLARVRVTADPALAPLPASSFEEVVGQRAALDIAAGGLLTEEATTAEVVPPVEMSIVGVALSPAQAPGMSLQSGDRVRIVVTPGQEAKTPAGPPPFNEAEVVGSGFDEVNGQLVVDLLVPYAEANVLAARVATGNVALVLDSGER